MTNFTFYFQVLQVIAWVGIGYPFVHAVVHGAITFYIGTYNDDLRSRICINYSCVRGSCQ